MLLPKVGCGFCHVYGNVGQEDLDRDGKWAICNGGGRSKMCTS